MFHPVFLVKETTFEESDQLLLNGQPGQVEKTYYFFAFGSKPESSQFARYEIVDIGGLPSIDDNVQAALATIFDATKESRAN